jgi:hypothetical protein
MGWLARSAEPHPLERLRTGRPRTLSCTVLSRIRAVSALLMILTYLAACGSHKAPAVAPPIALPSAGGQPLSIEAAGTRYEAIVAPSNDATDHVYDDIENHVDWHKVKDEVIALAEIEKQEAIDLSATRWPQEVASYIDEMIRREINTYSILYTARDATYPEQLYAVLDKAALQSACPVATVIRVRLNLHPPVPPCVNTP